MRHLGPTLLFAIAVAVSGCLDEPLDVDRSPPAAIRDLSVDLPISTTLRLTWTSSGDDGTAGAASMYEMRYSIADLRDEQALSVAPSLFLPVSQPEKTRQSIAIGNLERGRTYSFRVRAADEVPNWSAWSNVAWAPTSNVPPQASFELRPAAPVLGDTIVADATASSDVESEELDLRWDWDGNGTWDTEWTRNRISRHVVTRPGIYPVRLEVRDQARATGLAERLIAVPGFGCIARWSEVLVHVRGDCCVRAPRCRPCDYLSRDTTAECGVWRLESSARFVNGDARALQWVDHGLDVFRVTSDLSTREEGVESRARSACRATLEIYGRTSFTVRAVWNPRSIGGIAEWKAILCDAAGDTVSVIEGGISQTPGLAARSGWLEAGVHTFEVVVEANATTLVETACEIQLGSVLLRETARR